MLACEKSVILDLNGLMSHSEGGNIQNDEAAHVINVLMQNTKINKVLPYLNGLFEFDHVLVMDYSFTLLGLILALLRIGSE
jgi:hypothetical protein